MEGIRRTPLEGSHAWNSAGTSAGGGAASESECAVLPSCSPCASARGRWEQLTASPRTAPLGLVISTSHPCSCQGRDSRARRRQLTRFPDRAYGTGGRESGGQVGSAQLLRAFRFPSLHVPGGGGPRLLFSPPRPQQLAPSGYRREIHLLTKRPTEPVLGTPGSTSMVDGADADYSHIEMLNKMRHFNSDTSLNWRERKGNYRDP